jgi:hypothetical protein
MKTLNYFKRFVAKHVLCVKYFMTMRGVAQYVNSTGHNFILDSRW